MNNRRSFLRSAAIASTGALLIPGVFANKSQAHTISENKGLFKTAHQVDLRTSGLTNKHITVKGMIYDRSGLVARSYATIEILLPSTSLFQSSKSRKITTNEKGEYMFILDFPERVPGKSPRVKFNVSYEQNAYSTELIVNDFGAYITGQHWELNQQLNDKLFPKKETFSNHSEVTFNLSV